MAGATKRAKWGKKIEFILTCVAYSVGLGNVWRFPYLAFKNGGGAFLIPYWLTQIFVGMPLYFMELSFGQFASQGPITIWRANRLFKGIGISMVIVCAFITLYYNVIVSYCCFYLFSSMQSPLPWTHCDHYWSSPNCRVPVINGFNSTLGNHSEALNDSSTTLPGNVTNITDFVTPTQDYFERFALEMTDGMENLGGLNWKMSLCLLFAWIVVFLVLIKGIQSLGKVVYFTAIFPHVLLMSLLIRSALLPGATEGMLYFLTPRWSRLADATVWSDAATQVFFSLGVCMGGLNIMASFNNFKNNTFRDSLLVPCVDCFTSLVCGLVVFSVLGFMAHTKGVSIEEVATGGPGLAFIAYPEALASMPAPTVWAILFFFMMVIIGFSSQFSMCETVVSSICDEFPTVLRKTFKRTVLFRFLLCAATYLLALPMATGGGIYLLNILDSSIGGFPLLIIGISEVVAIMFVYGYNRFTEDIAMMLGKKPSKYFKFCWCFMSPVILMGVLIFKVVMYKPLTFEDYQYPEWAKALGWCIVVACVIFIPAWAMYYFYKHGGCKMMRSMCQPAPEWGPSLPENRIGRYATSTVPEKQTDGSIPSIIVSGPEETSRGISNPAYSIDEGLGSQDQGASIGPAENVSQGSGQSLEEVGTDVPPSADSMVRRNSVKSRGSFKGCIDGGIKGRGNGSIRSGGGGSIKGFAKGSFRGGAEGSVKGTDCSIKVGKDVGIKGSISGSIKSSRKGSIRGFVEMDTEEPGGYYPSERNVKGCEGTKVLTNGSITGYAKGGMKGKQDGVSLGRGPEGMEETTKGSIRGRNGGSIRGWVKSTDDEMDGRCNANVKGCSDGIDRGGSIYGSTKSCLDGNIKGSPDGSMKGLSKGGIKSRTDGSIKACSDGNVKGWNNGGIQGRGQGEVTGQPDGIIKGFRSSKMEDGCTGSVEKRQGINVVTVTKTGANKGKSYSKGAQDNTVYALDDVKTSAKKKTSDTKFGRYSENKTSLKQQGEVYSLEEPTTATLPKRSPSGTRTRGVRVFPLEDPTETDACSNGPGSRRSREINGIRAAPASSFRRLSRADAVEEDYVATVEG